MNRTAKKIAFLFTVMLILLPKQVAALPESGTGSPLEPVVTYDAEGLKDPFQPPEIKKEVQLPKIEPKPEQPKIITLPSLTVQGIVWGGSLPQAIINQKIVKIGDTLEGARIIEIKKDGVTMTFQDQQFSLPSPALKNKNSDIAVEK